MREDNRSFVAILLSLAIAALVSYGRVAPPRTTHPPARAGGHADQPHSLKPARLPPVQHGTPDSDVQHQQAQRKAGSGLAVAPCPSDDDQPAQQDRRSSPIAPRHPRHPITSGDDRPQQPAPASRVSLQAAVEDIQEG